MIKTLGYICIVIAIAIIAFVVYRNSQYSSQVRTFSPYTLLSSSWDKYKQKFINKDGRVIDPSQNSITTSEGQSYAMLRAVWSDDRAEFDLVWNFTKNNLKRPNDNLFGWRWGKLPNGTYGFAADGGNNSASDADSDIALALILAGDRWNQSSYLDDAKKILPDLWAIDTAMADGNRYEIAGNWAQSDRELIINPSYFAPYAWRIFAKVDTKHDWMSLVNPAYQVLSSSGQVPLDKSKSVGLPPNWLALDRASATVLPPDITGYTTDYSYDAIRVPWRIALDYIWNKDPQAKQYLSQSFSYLSNLYKKNGKLAASYAHDGSVLDSHESSLMYSTLIGYFMITNPQLAQKMYNNKIVNLYSNDQNTFDPSLPYYEQNWLWFGAALFNNQIINYAQ